MISYVGDADAKTKAQGSVTVFSERGKATNSTDGLLLRGRAL